MLLSLLQNFSLKIKRGASLVAVPKIFLKVFLKKYKLYNQIKREIVPKKNNKKRNSYIDNNNNKKTRKYIKFTITFYRFSYFEIGA